MEGGEFLSGAVVSAFFILLFTPPFQDCGGFKESYVIEKKLQEKNELCEYAFESSNMTFKTSNCKYNVGDTLKLWKPE